MRKLCLKFGVPSNASKYKMVVNVVDDENVVGVNPTSELLDFGDLSRNKGITRYVSMENGGGIPVYVVALKAGNISGLVNIDRNYTTLEPGQRVEIGFEINIPPSAETKVYSGWVWIFRLPKII